MNGKYESTWIFLACVVATALLTAGSAHADSAKAALEKGVALFNEKQYSHAAEAFREAYRLKPSWKLWYNIGQSEAAAARYGLALEAFESYLVEGADDVPDKRREDVLSEIQRLRVLVGTLEIDAPEGLKLTIDGISRGLTPFDGPVRVAAGKHQVQLLQADEVLLDKTLTVAGGMPTAFELKTDSSEPATPTSEEQTTLPETSETNEGPSGLFIGAIASTAVGVGGLVLGSFFAYEGSQDYDELKKLSLGGDKKRFDQINEQEMPRDKALTIVGFTAGGALVITGVVLFVIDARSDTREPSPVEIAPAPGGAIVRF